MTFLSEADKVRSTYRRDIQALRGIAVLLVIAYHARFPFIHGGYLGVDIFFVISGFLITTLIFRELQSETFSITNFYWRRAWRLLPAAYTTIAFCIAVSPFFLNAAGINDLSYQVIGAVTLTANIALWMQTGYFDDAASLKPLLHFWSLAIEEQYYLLLPAALVLLPVRRWLLLMLAITSASAIAYLAGPELVAPRTAFFLLPTRGWELGFGSLAALIVANRTFTFLRPGRYVEMLALSAIAVVIVHPFSGNQAGVDAFIACAAAFALMLFPAQLLTRGIAARALTWIGDRSYSLYLVHWPIFAFLHNAYPSGGIAWPVRLLAFLLSLLAGWVLYRTVETRYRAIGRESPSALLAMRLLVVTVALVAVSQAVTLWANSHSDMTNRMRRNVGLDESCTSSGAYERHRRCETSETPKLVVWGDSFAMHIVPGLVGQSAQLMQATRAKCAPLTSVAHYSALYGSAWGNSCILFNQTVLKQVVALPSVEVVVLAGHWLYLLDGDLLQDRGGSSAIVRSSPQILEAAFSNTIAAIRSAGKRVVIVEDPPWAGFDAGRCNERMIDGGVIFETNLRCDISRAAYDRRTAEMRSMLRRVGEREQVAVLRLDEALCTGSRCDTRWGDKILYRDDVHLSYEGSVALAEKIKMLNLLQEMAR